jgi:hypothetical protein
MNDTVVIATLSAVFFAQGMTGLDRAVRGYFLAGFSVESWYPELTASPSLMYAPLLVLPYKRSP